MKIITNVAGIIDNAENISVTTQSNLYFYNYKFYFNVFINFTINFDDIYYFFSSIIINYTAQKSFNAAYILF